MSLPNAVSVDYGKMNTDDKAKRHGGEPQRMAKEICAKLAPLRGRQPVITVWNTETPGVIEVGCKTVIGCKCKQSCMFLGRTRAQNILALRCIRTRLPQND